MLPSRPPRKRPRPFPLIPLLAAGLIGAGMLQIGLSFWPKIIGENPTLTAADPFGAVVQLKGRHAAAQYAAQNQPPQLPLPAGQPLLVLGNPQGPVTLTALLNPSLKAHRQALQQWANLAIQRARIEVYFAPESANSTSFGGGMALAMARAQNLENKLWQALNTKPTDWQPTELFNEISILGIPLADIRQQLSAPNPKPLQALQPGLAWASANRIYAPALLLDGHLVAPPLMQPRLLPQYIERRLQGEALVQPADFL